MSLSGGGGRRSAGDGRVLAWRVLAVDGAGVVRVVVVVRRRARVDAWLCGRLVVRGDRRRSRLFLVASRLLALPPTPPLELALHDHLVQLAAVLLHRQLHVVAQRRNHVVTDDALLRGIVKPEARTAMVE